MAGNIRVLVSNLGDGNWTGDAINIHSGDVTVFFPPSTNKGDPPTATQQLGGSVNTIGWGSKTNWLFQLDNRGGTTDIGDVSIFGYRPTGVPELIKLVLKTEFPGGTVFTWGGAGGEEVYGPFVAFKFVLSDISNAPSINCYIVGWNEGDVWDNQPDLTIT
jgi:hypothetical protein